MIVHGCIIQGNCAVESTGKLKIPICRLFPRPLNHTVRGRGYHPWSERTCEKSQCQNPILNQFNQVSEGCGVDTTIFKFCQTVLMSSHCENQWRSGSQTRVCLKSSPEHTACGPVCGSLTERIATQLKLSSLRQLDRLKKN